ncbi:MAG: MBL fold metallo-hydrolase [Gemmatimonadota bacterium]|nr:MBL fold metallo-hydrolase [Gemmatimonadota bacterium]
MKITLVSHASILVETNGIRILTDPWYSGLIYQNAWELCPAPRVLPDFRLHDGIFISHAHPDHYHLPTLERIKEESGRDVPIFVAKFFHGTIARDLRDMGFREVIEMTPGQEIKPFPTVTLYSQQYRMDDSLLVVVGEGDETLVNINDAPLRGSTLDDLARRYPNVDYCTAQFAIAQGYPYCYENVPADFNREDLVRRFDSFARILKPRHMIPFASFVRFCNSDNAHMNKHKMGLAELQKVSTAELTVLYPGDSIERGVVSRDPANRDHFDSAQHDTSFVSERELVPLDDLDQKMQQFTRKLASRVPRLLRRKLPRFAFVLTDHPWGYLVANDHAIRRSKSELEKEPIQYHLASEVLAHAVDHDWGWADLSIGARFKARVAPGYEGREIWFWVIPMLGGEGYLTLRTLWFMRPRALKVWWGRRLEVFDYLRNMVSGRFMSSVIRKKTSVISP